MKTLSHNNQSGRSMVEMLGVLAIIGVLSVGGISGYSKAMEKYKLVKAMDQISMLVMNVRAAYATQSTYSGLNSVNAINLNIAPADMIVGTALRNTFGGTVSILHCGSSSAQCGDKFKDNRHFYIGMGKIGRDACRSIVTSDWGSEGMAGLSVNNNEMNEVGTSGATGFPITMSRADEICDNTGTGATNAIKFVFY